MIRDILESCGVNPYWKTVSILLGVFFRKTDVRSNTTSVYMSSHVGRMR